MLEVRDLKKYYKTKGGVEVHALDGVSIQFPETGMVFLLGKSGSGKSTLLNVSGGLDKPDSGEIIVKGKSSKDFSQSDFDSYRNTFIGFVFQEYNILNEFNIETNIALALELQGKKNDKKAVEDLLKQVDLEGLGKRKPNTLSGGQKQRIAIARALIKNPEIIMADEPTGALDSNTGKQVLDTLKKLSETKLVIIVSHDRDFAEEYADRIIELKDGKILSDHTKNFAKAEQLSDNVRKVGDGTIQIKDVSELSESDIKEVVKSLKGKGEVIISNNENNVAAFKKIAKITDDGSQQFFKDTDLKKIDIKSYDGSKTKFIKSKLPARHALRMGASNLKIKPGRLVFTMFLSVVAFSMFGILSTLMLYNPAFSQAKGLQEEAYESLVLEKKYNVHSTYVHIDKDGKETKEDEDTYDRETNISKEDIEKLNKNSVNLEFAGIYKKEIDISGYLFETSKMPYYSEIKSLYGLCDCGEEFLLRQNGFSRIAGSYPINDDEIAVSDYIFDLFKTCNYRKPDGTTFKQINTEADLIGEKISVILRNYSSGLQKTFDFTISGIYKTDQALMNSKYNDLKEEDHSSLSENNYNKLLASFKDVYKSSFAGLGYISTNFYDNNKAYLIPENNARIYVNTNPLYGLRFLTNTDYNYFKNTTDDKSGYYPGEYDSVSALTLSDIEEYKNYFKFFDINGNALSTAPGLGTDEVYVNVRSYGFKNSIQSLMNGSTGQMYARYDKDGNLSYFVPNENGYNYEVIYVNYETLDYSFENKPGYTSINDSDVVIDFDGDIVLINKYAYTNNDYSEAVEAYDEQHQNYVKCWFDRNGNYVACDSYYERALKEVDLSFLFYDPISKNIYLQDEVDYVDGQTVSKTDSSVTLTSINNYYVDEEGYPTNNIKDSRPPRKGVFVNPNTGELSFKKQNGSVFTDKYYKDTNGKIYFGLRTYTGYSYINKDETKIYTWYEDGCELGYVDMRWEGARTLRFVDGLDNSIDVIKGIAKIYAAGKDSWLIDDLKNNYGDLFDFDVVTSEPLTSADLKAVFGALDKYEAKYYNPETPGYKSPVGITTKNQFVYELNIAGIFVTDDMVECYQDILVSSEWKNRATSPYENYGSGRSIEKTKYQIDNSAQYGAAISMSDKSSEQIKFMTKEYDDDSFYRIDNSVSDTILFITDLLKELKLIFLIIGCVMAVFSGLMLLNFISTSISNKQKEIGILRAVGARGSDVFKIFFSEAAIICLICVAFSIVLSGVGCYIFNEKITDKLTIQFFEFGIVNVAIIFAIAFVVGLLGTLFPVIRASRRPPVESIRAL